MLKLKGLEGESGVLKRMWFAIGGQEGPYHQGVISASTWRKLGSESRSVGEKELGPRKGKNGGVPIWGALPGRAHGAS